MRNAQLFLASVKWRAPHVVADITPGKMAVPVALDSISQCFEASIPAYARDDAREGMQLAVKSLAPCIIVNAEGEAIPMTEHVHADTGDHWWIEEGPWVARGRYHDAPSFHRPHGDVRIRTGGEECVIHLYDPSLSDDDFALLLDDIKNWCWRMAIDESCYVTVPENAEVRTLSPDFLQIAEDFIRNANALLQLPHCELREAVEAQRMERLRPNTHSLRFLAQRGERHMVPGRSAIQHYDTPENRFAHGMLKRVISMLRWTVIAARDRAIRLDRTAAHYEERATELRTRTSERIDPGVLDENLRRSRTKRDEQAALLEQGHKKLQVKAECGFNPNHRKGWHEGVWTLVELGVDPESERIRNFLEKCPIAVVIGDLRIQQAVSVAGNTYYRASVETINLLDVWRDYDSEIAMLEAKRATIAVNEWQQPLPPQQLAERRREAETLVHRVTSLRDVAGRASADATAASALLAEAITNDRKAIRLGIQPDLRFVPSMVFLQSPPYAGALSSYRQLLSMTGVDDVILEGLLSLENVGLRDWPSVYERWCLVSLLRVLQDDFRFVFNKDDVRANLLRHCTGHRPGSFTARARRDDMRLELTLTYQATLTTGRTPDFLLTLRDAGQDRTIRCVLDAKSCAFQHRPTDATRDPWRYLDDCLDELVNQKNYGEDGANSVFILHSVNRCRCEQCAEPDSQRGPITQPTTLQSWANASAYGGDAVFSWEKERPEHRNGAVMVRPEAALPNLRRLVLMLIQFGLGRNDICASCGSGGSDITAQQGGGVGMHYRCGKGGFLSVSSHCFNCKKPIVKNQAWWSYHDLHPTDVWNIKCWACGSLLSPQ